MDLWIGNATRQVYQFNYRLPGMGLQYKWITMQPFTQGKISNLSSEEISIIVGQHAMYGIVREDEIDRASAFHGVCYSIDKMISSPRLVYLIENNTDKLIEQGHQTRLHSAVAQSILFDRVMVENGRPERVRNLDMTAEQDNKTDPNNDVPRFSSHIRVSEDRNQAPPEASPAWWSNSRRG